MKRCIDCAYLMTCEKASIGKNECNKFIKRTNEEEKKDENFGRIKRIERN